MSRIYYHGLHYPQDFYAIIKNGLKSSQCKLYFGRGIYLTKDLDIAYWYADVDPPKFPEYWGFLIEVTLKETARIIELTKLYNKKIITYLKKEFGKDILDPKRFYKVIPKNKKLKRKELIEIINFIHSRQRDTGPKYDRALGESLLLIDTKKYKIDGFGDPHDEGGIVITNPNVIEKVRYINPKNYKLKANEKDYRIEKEKIIFKTEFELYEISFEEEDDRKKNPNKYLPIEFKLKCTYDQYRGVIRIEDEGKNTRIIPDKEYDAGFFSDMTRFGVETAKQIDLFQQMKFFITSIHAEGISPDRYPKSWSGLENYRYNIKWRLDNFFRFLNNGKYYYKNLEIEN